MHQWGKLGRVTDEEHFLILVSQFHIESQCPALDGCPYRIEKQPVKVTLLCIQLEGSSLGVPNSVCWSLLSSNSGKTDEESSSLPDCLKEFGIGVFGEVLAYFEFTKGTCTLGVDISINFSLALSTGISVCVYLSGIRSLVIWETVSMVLRSWTSCDA